jgi:hypothetical protein
MLSRTRSTIITVVAAFSFAGTAIVPTVAQARPRIKQQANCVQNLPNGDKVEYASGTEITLVSANGSKHKFRCENGAWVRVATLEVAEGSIQPPVGGNAPESIVPPITTTSTPLAAS